MSFLEEVAVSDLETESSRIAPAAGVAFVRAVASQSLNWRSSRCWRNAPKQEPLKASPLSPFQASKTSTPHSM